MTVPPTESMRRERRAILALLVACALWGMSFNWNKEGQALLAARFAAVTGDERTTSLGPVGFVLLRFVAAVVICLACFPSARRGWSSQTVRAGVSGGSLLAGGMLLQHYGLAYTSESLSSFLTSLTVLFTPILATSILRHTVSGAMWSSIGCATLGVALMTVYREEGRFDVGALLGLLCAIVFSMHILVVDHFGRREEPWRFTVAQLTVASVLFIAFGLTRPGGPVLLDVAAWRQALPSPALLAYFAVATVFATLGTFGLMFRYQPQTTPTRAALTYLTEPLFATTYAWFASGRTIGAMAMIGGSLIIAGNLLAEAIARRGNGRVTAGAAPRPATDSDMQQAETPLY